MDNLYNLIAIIIIIYFIESITLLNANSISISYWFLRIKINFGYDGILFRNRRVVILNPFYPIQNAIITENLSFSISPEGLSKYKGDQNTIISEAHENNYIKFESINNVICEDKVIKINNKNFVNCQSTEFCMKTTQLIKELIKLKINDREKIICNFLRDSFDFKGLNISYVDFKKKTRLLDFISNTYWIFLFVIMPILLIKFGYFLYFEPILFSLLFVHVTCFAIYLKTFISLFGKNAVKLNLADLFYLLISPFLLIRANLTIAKNYFYKYNPLLILLFFSNEKYFKKFARNLIVDFQYPLFYRDVGEESRKIFDWYKVKMKELIQDFLKNNNYSIEFILNQNLPTGLGIVSYCPRCLSTYSSEIDNCIDCNGITLIKEKQQEKIQKS